MKQFMLFLIIIAISAEIAHAQTRKKSTQDEDRGTDRVEDFDERLSNTIE